MLKKKSLPIKPDEEFQKLGWEWMLEVDTMRYITSDVVAVTAQEAENYYQAGNELYEMFIEAAQYVIDNQLFSQLAIPQNLIELINLTWENDKNLHLYGRFDFSGGIDNKPIKLIEFNADTATCIPETAIIQWAQLKANGLENESQFNNLYHALTQNFKTLRTLNPEFKPSLLISGFEGYPEDDSNLAVIGEAAKEAGFQIAYEYIEKIDFSPTEGIFSQDSNGNFLKFDFWFKLIPWEIIANEEPELMDILTQIVKNNKAMIINPAYVMLFQSKALLKILSDLFPNHPLLLETSDQPLTNKSFCVEKVLFGREGANIRILDQNGTVIKNNGGDYADYPKIYQEYVDFVQDLEGNCYQAGVFFAYKTCGLGFRKGGRIINNTAQFSGHIIEN